jgi:hypothetical protein
MIINKKRQYLDTASIREACRCPSCSPFRRHKSSFAGWICPVCAVMNRTICALSCRHPVLLNNREACLTSIQVGAQPLRITATSVDREYSE